MSTKNFKNGKEINKNSYTMNQHTKDILDYEDNNKYSELSGHLMERFGVCKTKRQPKNKEWIRNVMQYDGIYEKEILDLIEKGKCRLYDRVSTAKLDQFTASAVDLVLPVGDKNFNLYNTPNVNLPKKIAEELLNQLKAFAVQQDPPLEVTQEDIDTLEKQVAETRALKMEQTVFDQLLESDYMDIIYKAIHSAGKLGVGVVKGPFNKPFKVTSYEQNEFGVWNTITKKIQKPYIEFVSAWDFFPDLDAKTLKEMDGAFFYHTLTKSDFNDLCSREDFNKKNIKSFIKANPNGNFQYEYYETELISHGNENNMTTTPNKYRVLEYWGSVPASKCREIFPEYDEYDDIEVCVWMVDGIVIKCILNPYESGERPYHVYSYKKSDSQLIGTGLCSLLEQDQRALNSVTRAIHNLMAWLANPAFSVNDDLVAGGQIINRIGPGDVIHRYGLDQSAAFPLLQTIELTNHLSELMALRQMYRDKMDDISNMNQILQGDLTGQASAGRTSSGIAALMGQANITLREFARDFDFFNTSIIKMMIEWNMMFSQDDSIKGDYQVYPRTATSLVQKQTQSNSLNNLVATMQPEERAITNWKQLYYARIVANNLDPDNLILSDKEQEQKNQQDQQMQAQQMQMAEQAQQMEQAKVQADIQLKTAKAQQAGVSSQNETDRVEIERLKALGGIETQRSNIEVQDNKLKLDALNTDHNFTRDMLDRIAQRFNSQNPKIIK